MNKKAQIGPTLNWVLGFFLIFFIILIYLGFSFVLAGKNKITGKESSFSVNYEMQKDAFFDISLFLEDYSFIAKKSVKQMIAQGDWENFDVMLKSFVDKNDYLKNSCYFFKVIDSSGNTIISKLSSLCTQDDANPSGKSESYSNSLLFYYDNKIFEFKYTIFDKS